MNEFVQLLSEAKQAGIGLEDIKEVMKDMEVKEE